MQREPLPKSTPPTGAWFSTYQPEEHTFVDLSGAGPSSLGDLIFLLILTPILTSVAYVLRVLFRKRPTEGRWKNYDGLVYAQIRDSNVNFYTTSRGTSRIVVKPPAISRPISTLANFRTYNFTPPRVAFTFADEFHIELYHDGEKPELTKFREELNALISPKN